MKLPFQSVRLGLLALLALHLANPLQSLAAENEITLEPQVALRISWNSEERREKRAMGEPDCLAVYAGRDRSLLKFDLSAIPQGAKVQKATLELTAWTAYGSNPDEIPSEVFKITTDWDPAAVGWVESKADEHWVNKGGDAVGIDGSEITPKKGPWGDPYAANTANPANQEPMEWDVTALVNEWVSGQSPNYGMMLASWGTNRLCFYDGSTGQGMPVLRIKLTK
jgi:hypothetical protein